MRNVFLSFSDKFVSYKRSRSSFLFSLRNKDGIQPFKCPIYDHRKDKAIYCFGKFGATFGERDHDLLICFDPESSSNLGHTYQLPPGYQYGTPQAKALLAGSEHFKPTEIEVLCGSF